MVATLTNEDEKVLVWIYGLTSQALATKLYGMIEGKIGELATFLADAALGAIRSGQVCITLKSIYRIQSFATTSEILQCNH